LQLLNQKVNHIEVRAQTIAHLGMSVKQTVANRYHWNTLLMRPTGAIANVQMWSPEKRWVYPAFGVMPNGTRSQHIHYDFPPWVGQL